MNKKSNIEVNYITLSRDLTQIYVQIIKLEGSIIIWIGDSSKKFENLSLSVTTRYVS